MKRFIPHVVGCFLVLCTCLADAIEFKHSINRLVAPVTLDQIINFDDGSKAKYGEITWPLNMNGWVSQANVNLFLQQELGYTPDRWSGVKRVWIEQCYKPDVNEINKIGKALIRQKVEDDGLILNSVNDLNYSKLPCVKQLIAEYKMTRLELVSPRRAEANFELSLEDGSKITKTIDWKFSAQINAMFLTGKSKKHSGLEALALSSKVVPWTGKELHDGFDLFDQRTIRNLPANTVLKSHHIEYVPDVTTGNHLRVNLEYGAVKIETSGKAITSGNTGQMIKVQIKGTNKISEAKVVNKGVVNVSV